ncbi:MAG: hypothetical protein ACP5D6_02675 [Kosmotogaceae bacterium]
MKKVLLAILVLSILVTFAFSAEANTVGESKITWVGLDTIAYGWPELNATGQITSVQGIALYIGYTWRNYFEPMSPEKTNLFWEAGLGLSGLHGGVGMTYPVTLNSGQFDYLYISGGIGVNLSPWGLLTGRILYGFINPYPWIGAGVTF